MNIALLVERVARLEPRRAAVFYGAEQVFDYGELRDAVARVAGALHAQGLVAGDRIGICMGNSVDYLLLMHGALWAGLVIVPINAKLHEREVDYIAGHAECKEVVTGANDALAGIGTHRMLAAPWVEKALAHPPAAACERGPDDLAWLFYTSGTTGRPKGVMLSHRNLQAMTLGYLSDVEQVHRDDTVVYAAPMSHGAGLYTFAYMSAGARHAIPRSGAFDAGELFDLGERLGRLCLFAAPTMVARLVAHAVEHDRDGGGFKTIVYGGGPMYVADIRRAREVMGSRFVQIYGQGESPMTITFLAREVIEDAGHARWLERLASVGVRQAAVDVRVVDAQGRSLPCGEIGEVAVSGDVVMQGYWRDPAATAATLRDGWLYTGDMGVLDEEGFLTLKDRSKDLIISGGSNIYPREVEEVLLLHANVREAAVIGVPDAEWGEAVVAFVALAQADDNIAPQLDALCLDHIARFKRPKRYVVIAALPKNHYGKVLKTALRELYVKHDDGEIGTQAP